MTFLPLECTVKSVYTCGVFGNIGRIQVENEVNAHVTVVCTILLMEKLLLVRRLYNLHQAMFFLCWICKWMGAATCGFCHLIGVQVEMG